MLKSHEKFHSANGKRQILIVDDEQVNRELLGAILSDEYEIIYAENGQEAVSRMKEYSQILSLVLLDLIMPVMDGMEVLRTIREDEALRSIPVIVITADRQAEVESLSLGAIDFIPKPFPRMEVVRARILRTIELSEDREIINSTERDPLTGLYNREFFYRYAEQFDQHHMDMPMDAIVIDVNHFHMINERFGSDYGDSVLRGIGEKVREMVRDTGGIVCRREADTFLVYCPHGKDYEKIIENASIGLEGEDSLANRVRLRMGVYADVDKTFDIERRFDRAKMAADTVKGNYAKNIGIYDSELHNKELFAEQLIEDFQKAIKENQFTVFYQPKFDVRTEIPVLASAEALVRWQHPELGMIAPGLFIPLFEDNGLIQALDHYVWRKAAAQVKDWKERYDITVPVSVNVSRIDMYDPGLIDLLQDILKENGLSTGEFLLEITESAYTQDSEQIIKVVGRMRELGFRIEMDDFGTGYSSLNMISTLPIDALKLDMQFIRNAFDKKTDTRMLEVIIDIADYLNVPVIAEGVETKEQLEALKVMGCDMVQGYYFSRPLPPEEYEHFVEEKKTMGTRAAIGGKSGSLFEKKRSDKRIERIAYALSSEFDSIYYIDTESGHFIEFNARGKYEDLQMQRSGDDFFDECRNNIGKVIHRDDREKVAAALEKSALTASVDEKGAYHLIYRKIVDGKSVYYRLKCIYANKTDKRHIVIGVSNIDDQITEGGKADMQGDSLVTFSAIAQALAQDYFCIYSVDAETGHFIEYSSHGEYRQLGIEKEGEDFFGQSVKNLGRVAHPDDVEMVQSFFGKEKVLEEIRTKGQFTLTYRLMFESGPAYVHLKAVSVEKEDTQHIIVGVSNIDGYN